MDTANCSCPHCEQKIEFDVEHVGVVVPCPTCGNEFKLSAPAVAPPLSDAVKNYLAESRATDSPPNPAQSQRLPAPTATRMRIVSKGDELELSGESVIIRRRGLANALAVGVSGDRTIRIETLTGIQVKLGEWWCPGYILFTYAGSKPFLGGFIEATQDPDAFIFGEEENEQVNAFKTEVEKLMRDFKHAASPATSGTLADELRKLAGLKEQGILSQSEFEAAKKKLLF